MDTSVINECMALSLKGKITFPEVVKRLAAGGTERYIADLVGLRQLSFGSNSHTYTSEMEFEAEAVPPVFDAAAVRCAIADIQQQKITYREFLQKIMAAGCSHYEVFIRGRKAVYFGRDGGMHVEEFPAAP